MPSGPRALTQVTTEELKKLLSAVHRRVVSCPLTVEALTRVGLQHRANDVLAVVRQLDERCVRTVLVAVIAERVTCSD